MDFNFTEGTKAVVTYLEIIHTAHDKLTSPFVIGGDNMSPSFLTQNTLFDFILLNRGTQPHQIFCEDKNGILERVDNKKALSAFKELNVPSLFELSKIHHAYSTVVLTLFPTATEGRRCLRSAVQCVEWGHVSGPFSYYSSLLQLD